MAVGTIAAIIGAAAAVGGTAIAYKGLSNAEKAQKAQQDYANQATGTQLSGPLASDPVTYDAATNYFKDRVYSGGATPYSNEWNDAFNEWAGGLQGQYGVDDYRKLNYGQLTGQTGSNSAIPSSVAGPGGTINLAAAQQAAQAAAQQNAANSAALEAQYNPGAAELRAGSLQSLLAELNADRSQRDALAAQVAAQAGKPLTVGAAQQYDSALTRQGV